MRLCSHDLDISMPEIDGDLRTVQADWGATFQVDTALAVHATCLSGVRSLRCGASVSPIAGRCTHDIRQ